MEKEIHFNTLTVADIVLCRRADKGASTFFLAFVRRIYSYTKQTLQRNHNLSTNSRQFLNLTDGQGKAKLYNVADKED